MLIPVILAGGTGTRLWPLSRSAYPKQLLPLLSSQTMLQETALRAKKLSDCEDIIVVCNEAHRFLVAEQLHTIGINNATIILEPTGKNTAPAAALASFYLQERDDDVTLVVMPADHYIKDEMVFTQSIKQALVYAQKEFLIMFGIQPLHSESGYGYIKARLPAIENNVYQVSEFCEKPEAAIAKQYVESGEYFWNSGIFVFTPRSYLEELKKYSPSVFNTCSNTMNDLTRDLDFIRLKEASFSQIPNISIDYAVMEKTQLALLIPLEAGWNDIGSWSALCDVNLSDENGNVIQGNVLHHDVSNSYLRAEDRMLVAIGLENQIVVETPDAILIAHKNKCQEIKQVVSRLKEMQRPEVDLHRRVFRPWGYYEVLTVQANFQVKKLHLKPYAKISLQAHHHRSEHWVVVVGKVQVTCGETDFTIHANQSTYIPKETKHRLSNLSSESVEIIEVQIGDYLGEDDITRFDDDYGRHAY